MVIRDPKTGQFVAGDDYEDVEVVTFSSSVSVEAASLTGATGLAGERFNFMGLELIDYDNIVDRNESLVLLQADHALTVYQNSTATGDGTVQAMIEVSADPSTSDTTMISPTNIGQGGEGVVGNGQMDDSIDLIGRPLVATGHAPFSDTVAQLGGGGSAGEDSVKTDVFPSETGRFHPRDELFMNGEFHAWSIDDAAIHADLMGQHVYGVVSE